MLHDLDDTWLEKDLRFCSIFKPIYAHPACCLLISHRRLTSHWQTVPVRDLLTAGVQPDRKTEQISFECMVSWVNLTNKKGFCRQKLYLYGRIEAATHRNSLAPVDHAQRPFRSSTLLPVARRIPALLRCRTEHASVKCPYKNGGFVPAMNIVPFIGQTVPAACRVEFGRRLLGYPRNDHDSAKCMVRALFPRDFSLWRR